MQHYLVMFGATVANPLVLAPALCISESQNLAKAELIGTIFVVSGITTLLQTILGLRYENCGKMSFLIYYFFWFNSRKIS